MAEPYATAATRRVEYVDAAGTSHRYTHLMLGCPGCGGFHTVYVNTEPGDTGREPWEWDGNLDAPTVSPSILVNASRPDHRCHSFMRAGRWEFLSDCDHALAGQTVPLGPLPAWLLDERLTAQNDQERKRPCRRSCADKGGPGCDCRPSQNDPEPTP